MQKLFQNGSSLKQQFINTWARHRHIAHSKSASWLRVILYISQVKNERKEPPLILRDDHILLNYISYGIIQNTYRANNWDISWRDNHSLREDMQEIAEIVAWIKDYPSRPGAVKNEYSCLNLRKKANFKLISVSEYDHKWLRYMEGGPGCIIITRKLGLRTCTDMAPGIYAGQTIWTVSLGLVWHFYCCNFREMHVWPDTVQVLEICPPLYASIQQTII